MDELYSYISITRHFDHIFVENHTFYKTAVPSSVQAWASLVKNYFSQPVISSVIVKLSFNQNALIVFGIALEKLNNDITFIITNLYCPGC